MKKLGVFSNRYVSRNLFIAYTALVAVVYLTNMSIVFLIYKCLKVDDIAVAFRFYAGAQLTDGCFISLLTVFLFFLYNILQRFRKINKILMYYANRRADRRKKSIVS